MLSANALSLAYDAMGSIVNSNGLAIERDVSSRITAITYAAEKGVRYEYNCRGLLTKISDWQRGSTDLAYDAARQLISISSPIV